MSIGDNAIVIRVNERYFVGFGKGGRLQTGWSLSSAKLFADWLQDEIKEVETKLTKKGYKPIRKTVTCETEPLQVPIEQDKDYDEYLQVQYPVTEPEPEPEPVQAICYSAQDVGAEVEKPCDADEYPPETNFEWLEYHLSRAFVYPKPEPVRAICYSAQDVLTEVGLPKSQYVTDTQLQIISQVVSMESEGRHTFTCPITEIGLMVEISDLCNHGYLKQVGYIDGVEAFSVTEMGRALVEDPPTTLVR